ncbi:MAG: NAD(P)-dependent oxidoreductase [Proteobacteria bacterium]|nr:NAD(P)-dependent oxidoreductase [Pseudomonadota bacterium]NBP13371.1 NAD(P)-dependent oxidoreductase [bacterium]
MKYLILGSAGQIGEGMVEYYTSTDDSVVTFDIVDSSHQDLRISGAADEAIRHSDFVFFLAFDVGGSRYLKKYQHTYDFISNNMSIISNTFNSLKKYNKPFIFASSQMSNMDYSPYGVLKSIGENYTKILNGLVVKFWNVYGYERNREKSHVITDFILAAKANKRIEMLTNGQEERQLLYVEDCCKCLDYLSKHYEAISREENLHITSFEWIKILDVAKTIATFYPGTVIQPSQTIDTVQLNKKNEPSKDIFKYWRPETNLKEGISNIIRKMDRYDN